MTATVSVENDKGPCLFQGYGVELEYMIVERETLDVLPVTDKLLFKISGVYDGEVEVGPLGWSNELVLHVVELKTLGPAAFLAGLATSFQKDVGQINRLLAEHNACLLPTAMHPWMDPCRETMLWPHGNREIYELYNRIFDCRGHGWANLQSAHLNLAFCGDDEFARLHTAIRLVLPIIPALAASSPVVQGQTSGMMDTRLEYYRQNQKRIPSISGNIIPEAVFSRTDYHQRILVPIYQDIAIHDPGRILQYEWLNSRGAIARFERNAIEIRLIDVQECPRADLAIAMVIVAVLKLLVSQKFSSLKEQASLSEERLAVILAETVKNGEQAVISDQAYLSQFGYYGSSLAAGELWQKAAMDSMPDLVAEDADLAETLRLITTEGPLARRILKALGRDFSRDRLHLVYQKLCSCLEQGELFTGL